jgi:hypothetical protein
MEARILAQWKVPSLRPAVCKKISYVDVNTRDRIPGSVGGEAGEAVSPAFAADDGV